MNRHRRCNVAPTNKPLSLAYGCGLRSSEVVRLRVGDIDREQKIIRIVQSKGRKDRYLMLPAMVLVLLRRWWKARPSADDAGVAPEQRWLFPGRSDHRPLTTRQFGRLFKEAAPAAGLRKRVSLHSLRHSFATHLLEHGKDMHVIEQAIGGAHIFRIEYLRSNAKGCLQGSETQGSHVQAALKRTSPRRSGSP
jgi:integrase/recombinase XerD